VDVCANHLVGVRDRDVFFFTPKSSMLLCRLKMQMEAGDLPLRDIPVLRFWISQQGTGARLDHRETAGSQPPPSSVEKKDIPIPRNAIAAEVPQ
jgi:hypothetical protein